MESSEISNTSFEVTRTIVLTFGFNWSSGFWGEEFFSKAYRRWQTINNGPYFYCCPDIRTILNVVFFYLVGYWVNFTLFTCKINKKHYCCLSVLSLIDLSYISKILSNRSSCFQLLSFISFKESTAFCWFFSIGHVGADQQWSLFLLLPRYKNNPKCCFFLPCRILG
jgi:hypothetical protein